MKSSEQRWEMKHSCTYKDTSAASICMHHGVGSNNDLCMNVCVHASMYTWRSKSKVMKSGFPEITQTFTKLMFGFRGSPAAFEITVTSPLTPATLRGASSLAGTAAYATECRDSSLCNRMQGQQPMQQNAAESM